MHPHGTGGPEVGGATRVARDVAAGIEPARNRAVSVPAASPGVEKKGAAPRDGAERPFGGDDRRREKRRAYFSAAPMRARAVTTFSRELNALMRTWPSPHLPKPAPGVQTTWALFSNRSKNSHESRPVLIQR